MWFDGVLVERIAAELHAEVERRNEWYGLDNWAPSEVVEFVLARLPEVREPTQGHTCGD